MINDITNDCEDGMKKAIEAFRRDLSKIRTGRASTSMLDGVKVDYYGTLTPVNQVATVQVVDARLITVKPWEKPMIALIDKAIRASDLGLNPVSDAELVRIPIPPLTQERRKDLAKQVKKMSEDARVAVRDDHQRHADERTLQADQLQGQLDANSLKVIDQGIHLNELILCVKAAERALNALSGEDRATAEDALQSTDAEYRSASSFLAERNGTPAPADATPP